MPNAADANRKVKAGTPFTRPNLIHHKLIGAAGIVPNNMHKHKQKPVKYECSLYAFEFAEPLPVSPCFSLSTMFLDCCFYLLSSSCFSWLLATVMSHLLVVPTLNNKYFTQTLFPAMLIYWAS